MGLAERLAFTVMTLEAQLPAGFYQHSLQIGAVGIMALQTVLGRGLMVLAFDPELGHRGMARQAQLWLILLEDTCVR